MRNNFKCIRCKFNTKEYKDVKTHVYDRHESVTDLVLPTINIKVGK